MRATTVGFFNEPFYTPEKSDAEIREYCLEQARVQLTTPIGGRHDEAALLRATQFATIAQAFRPEPADRPIEK
ncbi:hypothetical protein [Streptomyces sp. NPDC059744]|uniref:hypothetical protein n=1 Tax=Streptomyces sp. NPDC059744 TaxID=3346929 RepID=UPI00365EEEA7